MKALVACGGTEPRLCCQFWGMLLCRLSSSSKARLGAFYIVLKNLGVQLLLRGLVTTQGGGGGHSTQSCYSISNVQFSIEN